MSLLHSGCEDQTTRRHFQEVCACVCGGGGGQVFTLFNTSLSVNPSGCNLDVVYFLFLFEICCCLSFLFLTCCHDVRRCWQVIFPRGAHKCGGALKDCPAAQSTCFLISCVRVVVSTRRGSCWRDSARRRPPGFHHARSNSWRVRVFLHLWSEETWSSSVGGGCESSSGRTAFYPNREQQELLLSQVQPPKW